jgi:hypothetical protein
MPTLLHLSIILFIAGLIDFLIDKQYCRLLRPRLRFSVHIRVPGIHGIVELLSRQPTARYETLSSSGVSHFFDRMAFKVRRH